MKNLSDITSLNNELSSAVTNLAGYHTDMQNMARYYKTSAFYPRKAGENPGQNYLFDNYLQIFADKNIHYTSGFPVIKVDPTADDRESSDLREKILYGVHRASGSKMLQKRFARDATKFSVCVAETYMNFKKNCMEVRRYDPRHVYWKCADGNEQNVTAFWAVFPITLEEAKNTYGVTPTKDTVSDSVYAKADPNFHSMDGQKWFTMVIRWDDVHRVSWIGDKMVEEPHEHMLGVIPIDICAPFPSDDRRYLGEFYLNALIGLQAELNDVIRRRSNIVKRMSNPIVWGRNIQAKTYEDVKQALRDAETGVLGLGKDGEVGILQLQELKTLYEHENAIKADMQRISGFAVASFGESVGANTSGDALGMYFTPTVKHVEDQYISWTAFWESINSKILRGYDVFGGDGRRFKLSGYHPRSTLGSSSEGYSFNQSGNYSMEFGSEVIAGNYINRVIMPSIIPKNEIEEKRLIKEAVESKFISRSTGYEAFGIESPEDEKRLLMAEQSEPLLNPDGTGAILDRLQVSSQSPTALPPKAQLQTPVK